MKRNISKKPCSQCGKLFHPGILWRHEKYCQGNKKKIEKKIKEEWKQENGNYKCPYCNEKFSSYGIFLHIYKKHTEEGRNQDPNIGYKLGSQNIWNKGIPMTTEARDKLSKSLKGKKKEPITDKTRKKLSVSRIKSISEGNTKRWQSRTGQSYPEKYFEQYLMNEGLNFEMQYHIINEHRNYFLDFYFPDKKIDLEIDGLQHDWPDRMESDQIRDSFLNSIGIKVIRIKWGNPNSSKTNEYFRAKIDELKNLLSG